MLPRRDITIPQQDELEAWAFASGNGTRQTDTRLVEGAVSTDQGPQHPEVTAIPCPRPVLCIKEIKQRELVCRLLHRQSTDFSGLCGRSRTLVSHNVE